MRGECEGQRIKSALPYARQSVSITHNLLNINITLQRILLYARFFFFALVFSAPNFFLLTVF